MAKSRKTRGGGLTPEQDAAVELLYLADLPDARAIAARLGLTVQAVRGSIHRQRLGDRRDMMVFKAVADDDLRRRLLDASRMLDVGELEIAAKDLQLERALLHRAMSEAACGRADEALTTLVRLRAGRKDRQHLHRVAAGRSAVARDSTSGDDQLFEQLIDEFGKALER